MAITKRLVHVAKGSAAASKLTEKTAALNPYLLSIAFYAGDDATADILTHGESFVQAPLDEREMMISGLEEVTVNSTEGNPKGIDAEPLAKIGTRNDTVKKIVDGEEQTVTALAGDELNHAVAKNGAAGITLSNLNKLIGDLNDYVIKTNADANTNSAVTLEKAGTADEGCAATYIIKLGGSAVGGGLSGKINIPKDLFLKNAEFISAATSNDVTDAGGAATAGFAAGDPVLKFTWQLDADATSETDAAVSYVPVKELVDVYVGAVNTTTVQHKKCTSSIDTATEGTAYTVTTTIADSTAVPAGTTVTGTASGNGGKVIVTTLDDNIKSALAKAESAEAYTDASVSELATAIGVSKNAGAVTYSGTTDDKVLNEYRAVDKTAKTDDGKVIYKSQYDEAGEDITKVTGASAGTAQLGNAQGQTSVATALTELTKAVLGNLDDIIRLYENSDSVQDALEDALDTIEVNGRKFIKDANDSNKLKSTVEAGDIKLKLYRNETTKLPEANQTEDAALISASAAGGNFANVYTDGLAITNSDTIYDAFSKLEQMWLWEEL